MKMQFCEVVVQDDAFCGEFADAFMEFWESLAFPNRIDEIG